MNWDNPDQSPGRQPERATDPWPAELLAWHARLVGGDGAARAAIATMLLHRLVQRLSLRFRTVDPSAVSDAATDAICDYLRRPDVFDARRGTALEGFLARRAEYVLRHYIRDLQGQICKEQTEEQPFWDMLPAPAPSPADATIGEETRRLLVPQVERLVPDANDRAALQLWANGERRTAVFARAWGLSDLSWPEQQAAVIRRKKCLAARLKRWATRRTIPPQTLAVLVATLAP